MLSKKYYKMIAKVIKDNTSDDKHKRFNGSRLYKYSLIKDMCQEFAKDNSLFNRNRFMRACDLEDENY